MSTLQIKDDCSNPTDEELFGLYARYPEITFDKPETPHHTPSKEIQSSPSTVEKEEVETSRISDSTAHTTPLRQQQFRIGNPPDPSNLPGFLRLIHETDLGDECTHAFVSLCYGITRIGQSIFSAAGVLRIKDGNRPAFADFEWLLTQIREISTRVEEQIENAMRIKSLVAFQSRPEDRFLWSCYRQRAQLIIRYTALPSRGEHNLIRALTLFFNNQIYRPVIDQTDEDELSSDIMRIVNQLYDTIMTWEANYRFWCDHMVDLRYNYMMPLLERIQSTPTVLQEVRDFHKSKEIASEAADREESTTLLSADIKVIQALNLSARKKGVFLKRRKTRYKREHTL